MKSPLNIIGMVLLGVFLVLAILGLCGNPPLVLYSLIPGIAGNLIIALADKKKGI